MSEVIETREFRMADYEAAAALWRRVEGVEVAEGDEPASVAQFLARNPGLSRAAFDRSTLIGVALCGHDGRRGHIYHLAVDPTWQNAGVGRRLVHECLQGLRAAGLKRAIILVATDNPRGRAFWMRRGWEQLSFAEAMGIDL